jgi:hypothetical protein
MTPPRAPDLHQLVRRAQTLADADGSGTLSAAFVPGVSTGSRSRAAGCHATSAASTSAQSFVQVEDDHAGKAIEARDMEEERTLARGDPDLGRIL